MMEWTEVEEREARTEQEKSVFYLRREDTDNHRPKYHHQWWFKKLDGGIVELVDYECGRDTHPNKERGIKKAFREFPIMEVRNEDGDAIAKLEINA